MRGLVAAAACAMAFAACPADLNNYASSNTQLQLQFPIQLTWKPYFKVFGNNTYIGDLDTLCPKITRTMQLKDQNGNQLLRLEGQITLFGALTGSWLSTKVFDCADNYIARIDESWVDAYVAQYGFSSSYTIVAPDGSTYGTATADFLSSTIQIMSPSMGNTVTGKAQWRWRFMSIFENDYGINIVQYTPNTAGRAEIITSLTALGYLRYIGSSRSTTATTDECSRFVITGVPVLGLMWIAASVFLIVVLDNKFIAILLALILPVFVALFLAFAALAAFISFLCLIGKLCLSCCCKETARDCPPFLPLQLTIAGFAGAFVWALSVGGSSGRTASRMRTFSERGRNLSRKAPMATSATTATDALIAPGGAGTTPTAGPPTTVAVVTPGDADPTSVPVEYQSPKDIK